MLVARDAALVKRAQVMRLHGMSRDAFDRFTATVSSWYCESVPLAPPMARAVCRLSSAL